MNESHYTEKICKVNAKSENARCFICVYGMHNSCFHESKNYGIIKSNIFFTDKKTETMKIKDFGKYFSGNLPCLREIFLFREGAKDYDKKRKGYYHIRFAAGALWSDKMLSESRKSMAAAHCHHPVCPVHRR